VILSELAGPRRVHIGAGLEAALAIRRRTRAPCWLAWARGGRQLPVVAAAMQGADASLARPCCSRCSRACCPGQEVDNRNRPSLIVHDRSHDQGMLGWAPLLALQGTATEGRPLEHLI
jgi:hypothetical protein